MRCVDSPMTTRQLTRRHALAINSVGNKARQQTTTTSPTPQAPKKKPFRSKRLIRQARRHRMWRTIYALFALILVGCLLAAARLTIVHQTNQIRFKASLDRGEIIKNAPDGSNEAKDENQITDDTIDKYNVPADHPRIIRIPTLNIHARVIPMGLNNDNSIQAPTNVHDTGWYNASSKPGQTGGYATFIDGHDLGPTGTGIFHDLKKLSIGDTITIETGNHHIVDYIVRKVEIAKLEDVNMSIALRPINPQKPGLNLMTCDGRVIKSGKSETQTHRVIVYAEQK